ncbi:hypothetical protein MAR_036145 [Mya arenaria]|uniref:Uncharacterized protein n=1 Tax=Mya arenaria TaxID=6604 RepID=A0ABY7EPM1_MYAAR|nr:hypothetical protein MAR_036145 [Mya arenaria]
MDVKPGGGMVNTSRNVKNVPPKPEIPMSAAGRVKGKKSFRNVAGNIMQVQKNINGTQEKKGDNSEKYLGVGGQILADM